MAETSQRRTLLSGLGLATALVVLTGVAYLPSLRGEFIWDDSGLITENKLVHADDGLRRFWFTTEASDYYPLTSSLWWLEWRLWGKKPVGYHAVNVLMHAANSVLIWLVLRQLKIPAAWAAALVFAVHPVNVATVAWISEQKNTLSMLFFAGAILAYLKFDETSRWNWYAGALGLFLLALLSKSAVVMLPVVLLLCVWWRQGRVLAKDILRAGPFFALALVFGFVTIWFQTHRALAGEEIRAESFAARLAGAGWVPWFYFFKAVWPIDLTVIYPKWQIDGSRLVSFLPGLLLVGCFTWFWIKRHTWGRPASFGLGYFVVTLFPVLGFIDQGFYTYSLVADHWQYYSIVGVIALSVAAIARWPAILAVVVIVLAAATWQRCGVYANDETLWRDNVAKNPASPDAHNHLGVTLWEDGEHQAALRHYEEAVRLNPNHIDARNNLGSSLLGLDRAPEAIAHLEQAVRLRPGFAQAHNNLGVALARVGADEAALEHYRTAAQLQPGYAAAHVNLARALDRLGRLGEAIEHYEQALRLKPGDTEMWNNLGAAYWRIGRPQDAIRCYEQALQLNPAHVEAHYNLAGALEQAGRIAEAIEQYEQALRIKPDFPEARTALARLQAKQ